MRRAVAAKSGAQGKEPGKTTSTGPTTARENGPSLPTTPISPVSPTTPIIAPVDLKDEPQSPVTDATQMLIKCAKSFIVIFPIYVLGYFDFSFSWVLVGLTIFFWWRRHQGHKNNRLTRSLAFLEHEDKTVKQSLATSELPPWVHYPDVERVEWLNKTVKQMWPYICQFVDKLFRETIEPAVKGANAHLSSFCFTKIDMGDKPLRVNGVKVYTENVDKRQIIMDLEISFIGNTEIDVDIKKYYCRAGIKSIQLQGVLRVVMEPLLGDMPLIGAIAVFFLKKPFLDINWTGLTNMLDIPGLNGLCDNLIQDIIYSYLVLPNRITIPLVGEAQLSQLRFPIPKGVLRIHFLEAQDLLAKDVFLGRIIKGKSDPYGVLHIGNQLFRSKVIKKTVNPKWHEVYEAMVYENSGPQNLEIELFDEDTDQDDFLGRLLIDIAELQKEQKIDEWFVLEEGDTGKLHLKLEWLSLHPTRENLDQVLTSNKVDKGQANADLSSALLVVFLDSARSLPSVFKGNLVFSENTASLYRTLYVSPLAYCILSGKKVGSIPNPFVHFTVGHKTYDSKTRYKTNEPVWEEAFPFLIHNPKCQELKIEVKDEKHDCSLGTLSLPLARLLEAEDMTLHQRFNLKSSGTNSTIKMKMALRVRVHEELQVPWCPHHQQTNMVQAHQDSREEGATKSIPPQETERIWHGRGGGGEPYSGGPVGIGLADAGRSTSNLAISGSHKHLAHFGSTVSIASDISNPYATQELQQRLNELQNGSAGHLPLGEVQLTVRHSPQRNKLIVVLHACRNLIAFTDHGSDPYVRLYLLPDKRRSGRRKTHTHKKDLNPVYDEIFEFGVSVVELHRRTLDVAVKNGGNIFSKHKGLLGKVLVDLTHEDIVKGWTQWSVKYFICLFIYFVQLLVRLSPVVFTHIFGDFFE
uniref:Extended synaptotagmin 2 n=1 Tax=Oncorhynchus mykiss TaxID=8022 RepID=A0A8C7TSV6_ONCMY